MMQSRSMGRRFVSGLASCLGLLVFGAGQALAQETSAIDSGDTTWLLTSSAIVLMMTAPGLALFYGGLVRRKNSLSTIMQSFILIAVISIQWVLWGYTLAFGPDIGSLIGGLDWLGLVGVGGEPSDYAPTVPHQAFMIFQGMFAIITPALITGAVADRMKFSGFLVFMVLWATFVYDPLAHWVWGGGWIGAMGALDFAGGTVVHISSGISALAAAIVLGKRRGYPQEPMPPHNLPFTVIGAALLWVGWFGFNAGSALAADAIATSAFVATNTAAAAATLGWMFTEWAVRGKPTVLGAASGAVAGLVGITPGAGFVTPLAALVIGAIAGVLCFLACNHQEPPGLRRFARCCRDSRRWRNGRSAAHRRLCLTSRQRGRHGAVVRQSRSAMDPACVRPGYNRVLLCDHLYSAENSGCGGRSAGG